MPRPNKWPVVAGILLTTIGLDQITKYWALSSLGDDRSISLFPTVELDLLYNTGFSFGTGVGKGPLIGVFVIGLSLFLVRRLWLEVSLARTALYSIILGGAIGNLLDRIFRASDGPLSGHVIDFIDVSWFAVFNVADAFVVCGCIAFVAYEYFHQDHEVRRIGSDPKRLTRDD